MSNLTKITIFHEKSLFQIHVLGKIGKNYYLKLEIWENYYLKSIFKLKLAKIVALSGKSEEIVT